MQGWLWCAHTPELQDADPVLLRETRPQAAATLPLKCRKNLQLLPLNPAFEPITLEPEDAGDITIVGEFVRVTT